MIYCLSLVGCNVSGTNSQKELNTKAISGKILFRDPLIDKSNTPDQGLVLLDPFTTAITPIGIFAGNARFTGSATKVLVDTALGKVELFDLETKESVQVYQSEIPFIQGLDIAYVDEKHFSLVEESKLILVNIMDGFKKVIAEDVGNHIHSWSGDGKTVYYSMHPTDENNKICRLNIETNKKEILFDGIAPRVSKDGNLIAYYSNDTDEKLIVKDLQSDHEWKYDGAPVKFCLSPDGEYVAVVEQWRGPWFYAGHTVKIWDYKANKSQTVVPKYANGQCVDIDWIE